MISTMATMKMKMKEPTMAKDRLAKGIANEFVHGLAQLRILCPDLEFSRRQCPACRLWHIYETCPNRDCPKYVAMSRTAPSYAYAPRAKDQNDEER